MKRTYLERYACPNRLIASPPSPELEMVVTIPCYNEPAITASLESLDACLLPDSVSIEVIVIINQTATSPQKVKDQNEQSYTALLTWAKKNSSNRKAYHIFFEKALPQKHAGVGLARKIAMDEAVRRLEWSNTPNGIIVCFDGDSKCDENYLEAIYGYFTNNPSSPGASIYFEHPLEGDLEPKIYEAITDYELFLRYYINGLRYAGFPYAFQTIGSAMAVRCNAYQKQGGMNKRKAGEDFYFLHKIIPLGHYGEINTTRVVPSPRRSDRVPFGTGKAVNEWLEKGSLSTYHFQIFADLKKFLCNVSGLYTIKISELNEMSDGWPDSIKLFMAQEKLAESLKRMIPHSKSLKTFRRHFFNWFDGFMVLKFVHLTRDTFYPNQPVGTGAKELLNHFSIRDIPEGNLNLLKKYRQIDRDQSIGSISN